MLNRLLIAGSLVAAGTFAAGAQMSTPPDGQASPPQLTAATRMEWCD